ncbi:MAG: hypothetical protein QHI48_01940 [Bacteroidota bacterium]|nr:hypothetical protein [Bacteroidota bacterium]
MSGEGATAGGDAASPRAADPTRAVAGVQDGGKGTRESGKRRNTPLLFALAAVFAFSLGARIGLVLQLPAGTATTPRGLYGFDDEPAHLAYAAFLLEHGRLPVQTARITDPDAFTRNEFEYHQPPLYYILTAALARLTGLERGSGLLALGRLLNVFLSLVSAWVILLLLRELGAGTRLSAGVLIVYALVGSSIYQGTVFGNDALSWFLLWWILLLTTRGIGRNTTVLIIALTLAHYTKSTVFIVYPVLAWAAVEEIRGERRQGHLGGYFAVFIVPLVFAGPWYLRNLLLYGGVIPFFPFFAEQGWKTPEASAHVLDRLIHLPHQFFFGVFFSPRRKFFDVVNKPFYLWSAWACAYGVFRFRAWLRRGRAARLALVLLATTAGAFLLFSASFGYVEARTLFPALPVLLLLLVRSLWAGPGERQGEISLAFFAVLMAAGWVHALFL